MKKMVFIFNPHTGGGRLKGPLLEILTMFAQAGYSLSVWPTLARGDARRFAQEQTAGADIVVCCGGDGTLNEVVNGLMQTENPPPIGYIPSGTTCDFASSLHLPKGNILASAKRIVQPNELFAFDVGIFNDKAFTYVAAFGAFTDVPYTAQQAQKNVLGHAAYLIEGAQRLSHLKPTHIRLECADGAFEDDYLVGLVSNSTSVAGMTYPGKKDVHLDDGQFEVLLVRYPQHLSQLGELSGTLLSGNISSPLITHLRIKAGRFICENKVSWTLDGEFGGEVTSVDFRVQSKALRIYI